MLSQLEGYVTMTTLRHLGRRVVRTKEGETRKGEKTNENEQEKRFLKVEVVTLLRGSCAAKPICKLGAPRPHLLTLLVGIVAGAG